MFATHRSVRALHSDIEELERRLTQLRHDLNCLRNIHEWTCRPAVVGVRVVCKHCYEPYRKEESTCPNQV